jgi:hypothetical protein
MCGCDVEKVMPSQSANNAIKDIIAKKGDVN